MFGSTGGFGQKPGGFGATNTANTGGGFSFGQNNANSNTTGTTGNTGGGFGFGQNNNNTNTNTNTNTAAGSGGFSFGQNNNAAASNTGATGGGLFGAKPAASGGLFGQNNAATTNTNTAGTTGGGFGFGQNNANTTAAAPSGGLFGAKPAAPSGGLFGNNNTTNNTTAAPSGGLFGGNNAASNTGGGLFGAKPAAPATGGLFGAKPATTGFGQQNTTNTNTGFGQQQQQQQPQLTVTPLTRPSDLPEHMQKEFEQIDEYIQQQARICDELSTNKLQHQETIESIPRDAELISRKYITAYEALVHDSESMNEIKTRSDIAAQEAQTCFNLLSYLTSQTPGRLNSNRPAGAPRENGDPLLNYFKSKCEEYEKRIEELAKVTAEVEAGVVGLEHSGPQNPSVVIDNFTISLEELYKLFMGLGNRVAELHHVVERLEQRK